MAVTWAGTAWATSTGYVLGARVLNDSGKVYRCTQAGTSAGAGGGPAGTGTGITDGTCTWDYHGADGGAVVGVAPEVTSAAPLTQAAILDAVDREVDESLWIDDADDGRKYLAAHLATISRSRGAGPVTAEAVGSLSRSYASLLAFGHLGQTSYGIEYLRRIRLLTAGAFGVVY